MTTHATSKTFVGHVPGVPVPSYDPSIDDILDEIQSPWGGGGNRMRAAICGLDGEAIYRVVSVDGLGEWMGLVAGLGRMGLVDQIHGQHHPQFDAIFAPSAELLASATVLPPAPPSVTDDLAAAADQLGRLDATEREQVILARQGQGRFRASLVRAFGGRCALTGFGFEPALRASHIKPWRDSSNDERLDPDNGLLLRADIDALFDAGYISFDAQGVLLVSAELPEEAAASIGLRPGMRLCQAAMTAERLEMLEHHRGKVYQA